MEFRKMAAAILAVISMSVVIFQIYSFVATFMHGQMEIIGAEGWINLFTYELGLSAYLAWLAYYFAYPERWNAGWLSAWLGPIRLILFLGIGFLIGSFLVGSLSLVVLMWSVLYALIISWGVKIFLPGMEQGPLTGLIIFFFIAEFFYIVGRKAILSNYVLGNLKALIAREVSEAKSMQAKAVAVLVSSSLIVSLAKVALTLLYFAFLFSNVMILGITLPTTIVAFIFTTIPVVVVSIMLSKIYDAIKTWFQKNFIRA